MLNLIKTRRSVRKYLDKPVPEELLAKVCEAGTYAATGHGLQSPRIVAITRPELVKRLSRMNAEILMEQHPQLREKNPDLDPFYGAPAVILVLADRNCRTYLYDGSLVMGNLMNAAEAVGLGSCWIHRARQMFQSPEGKALMQKWGIGESYVGIANCILGYAAAEPAAPTARRGDFVVRT